MDPAELVGRADRLVAEAGGLAAPGQQIADHAQQLFQFEGLFQVLVGPDVVSPNAVFDQRASTEDQHRDVVALAPERLANVVAAHAGEH